jgi:hypothetical protein
MFGAHQIIYFVALLFSPISGSSILRISNGFTLYALHMAAIWLSFNSLIPFSYILICFCDVFSTFANSVCVILCVSLNVLSLFIFFLLLSSICDIY